MKNNKGEISIMLIITVITILILVIIMIFMLTGENGLFILKNQPPRGGTTNNTEITNEIENNTTNQNTTNADDTTNKEALTIPLE